MGERCFQEYYSKNMGEKYFQEFDPQNLIWVDAESNMGRYVPS